MIKLKTDRIYIIDSFYYFSYKIIERINKFWPFYFSLENMTYSLCFFLLFFNFLSISIIEAHALGKIGSFLSFFSIIEERQLGKLESIIAFSIVFGIPMWILYLLTEKRSEEIKFKFESLDNTRRKYFKRWYLIYFFVSIFLFIGVLCLGSINEKGSSKEKTKTDRNYSKELILK